MYIRVGKMTQQFSICSSFQRGPCFGSNTYWVLLTVPLVPGALSPPSGLVEVAHILGNFFGGGLSRQGFFVCKRLYTENINKILVNVGL